MDLSMLHLFTWYLVNVAELKSLKTSCSGTVGELCREWEMRRGN